jgi:hypothetical protein
MSTDASSQGMTALAWTVILLAVALIALGWIWYGFSLEVHDRIWQDIFGRPGGPMSFRFVLQPTMAFIAALHDGIKDARLGRAPYFWSILSDPTQRASHLREGIVSTARIILLGLGMDAVYQDKVLGTFFPGEMVLMALLLAFVPYLVLRGPIARIARHWFLRHPQSGSAR